MSTAGQQLFNQVSGALWDLLNRCRSDAAAALAGLGPEPGFAGTVLDGRLLQSIRPDAISSADAAASALIGALTKLIPDPNDAGIPVTLHGYDPGAGQPRGLALVFVSSAPQVTLVAALTGAGAAGIAFELAAVGAGPFGPVTLGLSGGWSIAISGDVGGGARLQLPRGGPAQVLDPGAAIKASWTLQRPAGGDPIVLGPGSGPNLTLASVAVGAQTGLDAAGAPKVSFTISLPGANLSLSPDLLSALIGSALALPVDVEIGADPESGLSLTGGGVRVTLPTNVQLPGIELQAVELGVSSAASGLEFDFGVAFTSSLAGLPINLSVDGLGAGFPLALSGGTFGIDPGAVHPTLPSGFGVDLPLPALAGGGFLDSTGPGAYGGVLELDLIAISVQAFGLLQLPVGGMPLAFVGIVSVEFPFPGIQLSFGFSLNGVGGIIAVNRRLDQTALQAAVIDGSADQLMFPADPAGHALTIIATLGRVFPVADGHLVIGPMLQIGWGGRILTLAVAVIIDLPNPVQFVIIGRLAVALPDPDVPLVLIQAILVGVFEISPTPLVSLTASLAGSNIAGMPLHGDMLFLSRGGDDPLFVLSVGGFHPRYVRPAGIPALARVQLDITPPGFPGLRSEAYFAITSNSVQFGAHLELCDEIAGCGVDGWFAFDALFLWDPVFSFSIQASAGVAVQVLGESLMGINFALLLEGPAPWHVHGTGSIDLFLFSASLDFDVSWGSAPPALPPPPDLGPVLAAALADPAAWITAPPQNDTSMVSLSQQATTGVEGGHLMHPLGQVTVRQRAVPLGIQISRYQNQPIPPQTWNIAAADLAENSPATLGTPTVDEFPPGQFLDLSEDEKLSKPAFDQMTSGIALTTGNVIAPDMRSVDTDFETVLVPDILLGINLLFVLAEAEYLLTVIDPHLLEALWSAPNLATVTVLPTQPLAVATTDTFQAQSLSAPVQGFTATFQAAQTQFGAVGPAASVQLVEQWELTA